jgi:4-hydroxythreonine-4-phosphate dehydrogenase
VNKTIPRLVLTPGEPVGIGPDICVMLAQQTLSVELVVVAEKELLAKRARHLGLPLQFKDFDSSEEIVLHQPGTLKIINESLIAPVELGILNKANAPYVQTLLMC